MSATNPFFFCKVILNTVLIFGLVFFSENALATHQAGGNLTYTCLGSNQVSIDLALYRDCNGINLASTQTISWTSDCGSGSLSVTRIGETDVTPLAFSAPSACNAGTGSFGMEEHVYNGILTLPPGCNNLTLSFRICCRNNPITTIVNPGSSRMYISASTDSVALCNISPTFLNPPLFYTCINQPVVYNPGVVESEGDSLAFSLVDCLDNAGLPVAYVTGYSATNFLGASVPVTLNPTTGELTFTPTAIEVAPICIEVQEYRNGMLIGSVRRDIQYYVLNCNNAPPMLRGVNGTATYELTTCANTPICFDVYSIDTNAVDSVRLFWKGAISGATFTSMSGQTKDTAIGTFCWTPTDADIGSHQVFITAQDNVQPIVGQAIKSYTIHVTSPSAIIVNSSDATISNPPNGSASAQAQGGIAPFLYDWGANTANQTSSTATGLAAGNYCVSITDSAGCMDTACVTISLLSSTHLKKEKDQTIILYPNPVSENLQIKCIGLTSKKEVEVFDYLGHLVYYEEVDEQLFTLALKNWANGIYLIRIRTNKSQTIVKKFIIQH